MLFSRFSLILFFLINLYSFSSDTGFEQRTVNPYIKQIGSYRNTKEKTEYQAITTEEVNNFLKTQYLSEADSVKKDEPKADAPKQDEKQIPPTKDATSNSDEFLSSILKYRPAKWSGDYRSLRIFSGLPMSKINFNASEARIISNTSSQTFNLFNGTSSIGFSPGFSAAIGYAFQSYYSFEVELQYIMLNSKVTSVNNLSSDNNFQINSSVTSFSVFSLFINNHLRVDFWDGKIETFFGCGIGIGYAIPKDKYFINSAIILPGLMMEAGANIGISEKVKLGIFWRTQFMSFKATNKHPFQDSTGNQIDNRPTSDGNVVFKNILVNTVGIELKFF